MPQAEVITLHYRRQVQKRADNPNLAAALELAEAGYAVFPCAPDKRPLLKDWQGKATRDKATLAGWWAKKPDAMPALPCGRRNALAVLDVDRKKGKDGFVALRKLGLDPESLSHVRVDTPSGGAHFYFAWPEGMGNSASGLPEGVDVRGEGGFVVAPGAVNDLGTYRPGKAALVDDLLGLPDWPATLRPKRPARADSTTPCTIPLDMLRSALMALPNVGEEFSGRDDWLRIGMALHAETAGSADGLAIWHEWSGEWPGYAEDATDAAWQSFRRTDGPVKTGRTILAEARKRGWQDDLDGYLPEPESSPGDFDLDEDGVIRAFTERHGDTLRFDHIAGAWFKFDGNTWRREETKLAHHYARELATGMAEDDPKAKALRKVNVWEAIERGARTVREFAVTSAVWNRDPWLLGTPAGTVDLRTGALRSGNPADHISRLTAVAPLPLDSFRAERDCPRWITFLQEALAGDADAIRFLQAWGGYSLTGVTKEQSLVFIYGPGGSGKSTVVNTFAAILGEYAATVAASTLTAARHDAHPEEIARLDGVRLAWASETERGRAWAENRVKSLTGGDKVVARFMHKNSFEFLPQMKLMIVGNHRPSLTTVDEAIKRRFIILPFDHPPEAKDAELPDKLRAEWPGILSWMVQGCLDWQARGLVRPETVRRATDDYFAEQDTFGQWLEERCEVGQGKADTTERLWESWSTFAMRLGEDPGSKKRTFPETLSQRGFVSIKDTCGIRGRGYRGLTTTSHLQGGFDELL